MQLYTTVVCLDGSRGGSGICPKIGYFMSPSAWIQYQELQIIHKKQFNIIFDITKFNTNQVARQRLLPTGSNKVEHRFMIAVQKGHENFNYLLTIYIRHISTVRTIQIVVTCYKMTHRQLQRSHLYHAEKGYVFVSLRPGFWANVAK